MIDNFINDSFAKSLKIVIEKYFKEKAKKIGEDMLAEHMIKMKRLMVDCVATASVETLQMVSMERMGPTLTIVVKVPDSKKDT